MAFGLCKYRDIGGIPGMGIHSYRFMNIAIVDLGLTVIGAIIFAWIFRLNIWWTLIFFLLLGIIVHRLFCVRTTLDKLIFPYAK